LALLFSAIIAAFDSEEVELELLWIPSSDDILFDLSAIGLEAPPLFVLRLSENRRDTASTRDPKIPLDWRD
jgi:hypothetical protein